MKKAILFTLGAGLLATSGAAQPQLGERGTCFREIRELCDSGERGVIRACLIEKAKELSPQCQDRLRQRFGQRGDGQQADAYPGGIEISFGSDAKQKADFWPGKSANAPLVIFIHGGGWSIGDKGMDRGGKAAHFTSLGYGFASINYRLVPNVKPHEQAQDIANAIAALRKQGVDGNRIVLMGHSAGAHLAALVSSDPLYLAKAGVPVTAIRGTILLDGAGYDVAAQMAFNGNRVKSMFDAAFGADPAYQKSVSPISHAADPNVGEWLILHVERRADSRQQSEALAKALSKGGAHVKLLPVPDSTHMTVNRDAGAPDSFVGNAITAFLEKIL